MLVFDVACKSNKPVGVLNTNPTLFEFEKRLVKLVQVGLVEVEVETFLYLEIFMYKYLF